jgi:hypothetical protein
MPDDRLPQDGDAPLTPEQMKEFVRQEASRPEFMAEGKRVKESVDAGNVRRYTTEELREKARNAKRD